MSQTTDYLIAVFGSQGDTRLEGVFNRISAASGRTESSFARTQRANEAWMRAGVSGARTMAAAMDRFLQKSGEVSRIEAGYRTVLKNEAAVQKLSKGVRKFDVESNFSFLDSARASQGLLAAGFREDLIPTLYALGDATVASGKGTDTLVRLAATLGKIKAEDSLKAVRINQLTGAGIPDVRKILKSKLHLSDDDMLNIGKLHLKADVVIPALVEGFEERFSGGMKKAANQYLGAKDTFEGSRDKLEASVGKTFERDATAVYKVMTKATEATSDFVSLHPRLTKTAIAMGVVATGAMTGYGAVKRFAAAKDWMRRVTDGVTRSVERDVKIEKVKRGVAYKEATARHAAAAAAEHQTAANIGLAGTAMLPGPSVMLMLPGRALPMLPGVAPTPPMLPAPGAGAGVGPATGAAAAGIGSRIGAFWRTFLTGVQAKWAASKVGQFMGRQLFTDNFIGTMYEGGVSPLSPLGKFYGGATIGQAVGGLTSGAVVGMAAYDSFSNDKNQAAIRSYTGVQLGDGGAMAASIALGAAATALAVAFPPATAAIVGLTLAAKAGEYAYNKFVNEPAEKKAEEGTGADNKTLNGPDLDARLTAAQRGLNRARTKEAYDKQYALLAEQSRNAQLAGDDETAHAIGLRMMANRKERQKSLMPGGISYDIDQYTASVNGTSEKNKQALIDAFTAARMRPGAGAVYPTNGYWSDPELDAQQAQNQRDFGHRATPREQAAVQQARVQQTQINVGQERRSGGQTIEIRHTVEIPDRQADRDARRLRSMTMTPPPLY